jgi:penicillin-binding protein 1A
MSYRLGHTEDNAKVKKAVNKAQEYYNMQDKREWVEWASKTLMPHLHAQMVMEKADVARVEQEIMDELRLQEERAQRQEEQAAKKAELDKKEAELDKKEAELDKKKAELDKKEAELDKKETEYIQQVNAKEINKDQFWKLVAELDLERAMGESVVEGLATTQATTQDKEVGESEQDELAEEEPEVAEKVIELSTVGKGKQKVAPARAKMYAEVEGLVSNLPRSTLIHR